MVMPTSLASQNSPQYPLNNRYRAKPMYLMSEDFAPSVPLVKHFLHVLFVAHFQIMGKGSDADYTSVYV